ncbi:MAG: peptidylprolyl isomerase [Desulfuromusa sp.]|nr:peptidylprolyl isomerase [Desulfuromusa sp.]
MSTQPIVKMETNKGQITIELNAEKAPISTENFLNYVRDGFYGQTIFHRVIPNFMIQCGGFTPEMAQKKTQKEIKNEADNGLKNQRGALAMARTQVVDSASSQFFINLADNDFLNHQGKTPNGYGYAVFGRVTEGMDVVDEIAKAKTGNNGHHQDVPQETIVIESMSIEGPINTD